MNHHLHSRLCARCGRSKSPQSVVCPSCGWMPGKTFPVFPCLLVFIGLGLLGGIGGLLWHLFTQGR